MNLNNSARNCDVRTEDLEHDLGATVVAPHLPWRWNGNHVGLICRFSLSRNEGFGVVCCNMRLALTEPTSCPS